MERWGFSQCEGISVWVCCSIKRPASWEYGTFQCHQRFLTQVVESSHLKSQKWKPLHLSMGDRRRSWKMGVSGGSERTLFWGRALWTFWKRYRACLPSFPRKVSTKRSWEGPKEISRRLSKNKINCFWWQPTRKPQASQQVGQPASQQASEPVNHGGR